MLELIRNVQEVADSMAVSAALQQIRDAAELLNSVRSEEESGVTTPQQNEL